MINEIKNRKLPMFQVALTATVKVLFENLENDSVEEIYGTVIKIDKTTSPLLPIFTLIFDNGTTVKMNHDFFNATVTVIKGFERNRVAA